MPRKGTAYPIDAEWRRRVEARMAEKEWTRAELARQVKCSRSAITELFDEAQKQSSLVPAVHRVLGWDPPAPIFFSPDAQEVQSLYEMLPAFDRGEFVGWLRERAAQRAREAAATTALSTKSEKKPTRRNAK